MLLKVDEITEVKEVCVDVDKTFIYFDKLPNGQWRMTYTRDMEDCMQFFKEFRDER
jgi:hypothetical protein